MLSFWFAEDFFRREAACSEAGLWSADDVAHDVAGLASGARIGLARTVTVRESWTLDTAYGCMELNGCSVVGGREESWNCVGSRAYAGVAQRFGSGIQETSAD